MGGRGPEDRLVPSTFNPLGGSDSMFSFVYIWVLCFDVSAENNQIALIIIQPIWNTVAIFGD